MILLVTVPDGSSLNLEPEDGPLCRVWSFFRSKVSGFAKKIWKLGADDPRKFIHSIKVGLALALVSVFYYMRPLYDGVGGTAMWAIMTVVVIFEFTVGGSLYKGLNRATATLSAAFLAWSIHWLASKFGEPTEHIILGASVFILSSAATFSRFILTVKTKFDYGVTIFILTFNFIAVSGYRVDDLLALAQRRLFTIMIGVSICIIVSIVVFPVWAGEDLHLLIIRNMEKLANSLEYSATEYFKEGENADAHKSFYQKSQGYKCVLNSKASEDSLANLAIWEPSHGPFRIGHPWKQYLKVGSAMRSCSYSIEALNSFINSEVQVPRSLKNHLSDVCTKLSLEYHKVLKEAAKFLRTMRKSSTIELMMAEMNEAVEDVHSVLRSLKPAAEEEQKQHMLATESVNMMKVLPLISVVSLLIEISVKIEGIVDAVQDLADLAGFAADDNEKQEEIKPANSEETQRNETMKVIQQV
ncbi:uncharacterized protein A4U43_C08F4150 [Asparagus officinalis]|uniref:aluminum-activated malate transporter 10-like n=1 Tax=Asparagus officinalis TaxID=4686 RepID=UPI00098E0C85|nr:aluminum-activated malate transporter 10-like [Asparagus officinalis]ONK59214.1 uncharacterized protein A4U43_C08F4150 [Asparagus officinalis]